MRKYRMLRKGMNVGEEVVRLGRSGTDVLKAGEEDAQCGWSVSGVNRANFGAPKQTDLNGAEVSLSSVEIVKIVAGVGAVYLRWSVT